MSVDPGHSVVKPISALRWVFQLDDYVFDRFEVPEKFDLGHEIMTVEHKYIDETGNPIIKVHTMGAFPVPTKWNGMFYNATALPRANQLDQLSVGQKPIIWQYGPLQYLVVIKKFTFTPHFQFEVEYEIELAVIKNLNGVNGSGPTTTSYDNGTAQFYTQAQISFTALSGLDSALPDELLVAFDNMVLTLGDAIPLQNQTVGTLISVVNTIGVTLDALNDYIGPKEASVVDETGMAQLNQAHATSVNLGLLSTNLQQLVGQGPASITVPAYVGNLFDVAVSYYPNADIATAVTAIATANSLNDFFVSTPMDLKLPPLFA